MFKNQSSFTTVPSKDAIQNNPARIENAPIHTMAQDLQGPAVSAVESISPQEKTKERIISQNMSEKQQGSPFLNSPGTPDFSQKKPSTDAPKNPTLKTSEAPQISIKEDSTKGTIIAIIIAFFIVIIAGFGTYYFMLTRKTDMPDLAEELPSDPPLEVSEVIKDEDPVPAIKEDFSSINPNYVTIDEDIISQTPLKEILLQKSGEIISSGATTPIEFVITDKQNNPVAFSDFAKISGINLSTKILESLDKEFSLFILNDSSAPGIALAIKTINPTALKNTILKEEAMLSTELGPILLPEYEPSTNPFGNHTYKGQAVRYQNLISSQKLAVDYALTEKQLIFATTKLTIESVLDKLSLTSTPTEESPQQ